MNDKKLKELTADLAMLTVQFSAINKILMSLMMVLDPQALQSALDSIRSMRDTAEEVSVDRLATEYALAQLELAINGPRPQKRFQVVPKE